MDKRLTILISILICLSLTVFFIACEEENDTKSNGENSSDDDDNDAEHPCEGVYDVIIEGDYTDDFDWVTTWTTKYVINENDTTEGIVIPDAAGWETYEVIGERTSQGTGYSDGTFPTPPDLETFCTGDTVSIHVQYTISGDSFTGEATYECPDSIGTFEIFGTVTCGNP